MTGYLWTDEEIEAVKLEALAKTAGCPPGTRVGMQVYGKNVTIVATLPDSKLN